MERGRFPKKWKSSSARLGRHSGEIVKLVHTRPYGLVCAKPTDDLCNFAKITSTTAVATVNASATRPDQQAVDPGQHHGAPDRDQNCVNSPAVPLKAEGPHDPTAYNAARDTEEDVKSNSVPGPAHNFAGCPSGYESNNDPP